MLRTVYLRRKWYSKFQIFLIICGNFRSCCSLIKKSSLQIVFYTGNCDFSLPAKFHRKLIFTFACVSVIKENWEVLKTTAEIQKAKQLKNEMNALKTELLNWAASIESMETTVTSREELKAKIIQIKVSFISRHSRLLTEKEINFAFYACPPFASICPVGV